MLNPKRVLQRGGIKVPKVRRFKQVYSGMSEDQILLNRINATNSATALANEGYTIQQIKEYLIKMYNLESGDAYDVAKNIFDEMEN